MPVDTVFCLLGKAKDFIIFVIDRIDQLKLSENIVTRIKESLEYLKLTIHKIEPYIKKDSDTKELTDFLSHLENSSKLCSDILEKHPIIKVATIPSIIIKLHTLEAEVKAANSKLMLFMAANNLTMLSESIELQNEKLDKIVLLQENSMAGIHKVEDSSIRRPPAPPGFIIKENKNVFTLSWKPCGGVVDEYEVCYDEQNQSILSAGTGTTLKIGSPRVQPGKVYIMKVRGVNKGGKGEWSNSMVGQFTKPFPQKPEISNLLLRATIAVVTVTLPEAICSTESPVTCVEISYTTAHSKKLFSSEFKIEPGNHTYNFTVKDLHPDTKHNFRAKTRNTEGWSEFTDFREGSTLSLPPIPTKPNPPLIKACSSTEVKLIAQVPENTCGINSPIIAWRVTSCSGDKENVDRQYSVNEKSFAAKSVNLAVSNLDPKQQYTLQILAKNERGWSEPSRKFTIHIATPSPPKDVRVSSKRSHSLIKIRWNAPDSSLITHYEIEKRRKKDDYDENPITVPANKFSATFTKLKHNTNYCFRVRTCNGIHESDWSEEIETNTRIHKGIKAVLSPAVWAAGTVASPILTPIATGAAAGMIGNEASGKKAAVAAGTAGTVGGAALGIVGAPLIGAGMAHAFVHGTDFLSDQSDDEDAVIIES